MAELQYQSGFGNEFATEALPGALPVGRNSPQRCAYGLYAEQLSGTAFTAPRSDNRRSWLYRIRPSSMHRPFEEIDAGRLVSDFEATPATPNQLRWNPMPLPEVPTDFVQGLMTMAGHGGAQGQSGAAVHVYAANRSMQGRVFYNADGEMLIVPQQGSLTITTELGLLQVAPGEIALLPRGLVFKVDVDGPTRAYVCENHGAPFRLPELGPIGSNGLANPRDFLAPVAAFDTDPQATGPTEIVRKFGGSLWRTRVPTSPFNVVAWHGNLVPLKYDTKHFMVIGSISFDHPDPSIFTVLTSPSDTPGVANCDFVIFPPRWMVMEDTFRPPWYHRNVMAEFMGLVHGQYDAKPEGFKPGGMSLHNTMVPHGPDAEAFDKASNAALAPHKLDHTLAFMFESRWRFKVTDFALNGGALDAGYADCWQPLADRFCP